MAVKEFDNFEYDFAKQQKTQYQKRLKLAAFIFGLIIILFTCWSLISGINLFPQTQTNLNQPITNPSEVDEQLKQANQNAIDKYANVRIPYRDPQNRYRIDFSTPYVSDRVVVYINTSTNRDKIIQEANDIISTAKQSVEINNIQYVDNY